MNGDFAAGMRRFTPMDEDSFERNFGDNLVWKQGSFASSDVYSRVGSFGDVDAVQK